MMNYRSDMGAEEIAARFAEICRSAYGGEGAQGSVVDMAAHTAMANLYNAYFSGAKTIERCEAETERVRREYTLAKAREALNLEGYRRMQAMYMAIGDVMREYRRENTIETAEKLIAVIDGKHDEWRQEHEDKT